MSQSHESIDDLDLLGDIEYLTKKYGKKYAADPLRDDGGTGKEEQALLGDIEYLAEKYSKKYANALRDDGGTGKD
jgi:hypothetical protein